MTNAYFFDIPATSIAGLAGVTLIVIALAFRAVRAQSKPLKEQCLSILLSGFLVLLPLFFNEPIVVYVRGLTGDLSVASLLFATIFIVASLRRAPLFDGRQLYLFKITVAILSLCLYPFALGLGPFDTYRLGFDSWLFQWLVVGGALVAWFFNVPLVTFWLTLSLLSYYGLLYESSNLWDYLIDPFIALICLTPFLTAMIKSQWGRMRSFIKKPRRV